MKIIYRMLMLDMLAVIAEGVALFTFVFLLKRLYDLTDLLAAGSTTIATTGSLLFALLPSIMVLTFPMAILLAGLIVYGRLAHDNELVALLASGYSHRQLLTPVLILGLVLTVTLSWWAHRIAPKGLRMFQIIAADILQETATTGIRPGSFNPLGNFIFSPSEIEDGQMRYLRMFELKNEAVAGVITAPSGSIRFNPDDEILSLHLQNGVLHQIPSPDRDVVLQFEEMKFSVAIRDLLRKLARGGPDRQQKSDKQLQELIVSDRLAYENETRPNYKEYFYKQWKSWEIERASRGALPVACLLMALIGGLLGSSVHATRRSACYSMTIFVIFLYYVLLSFGKVFAEDGVIAPWLGVWIPNLACMGVLAILFYRTRRVVS